MILLAKFGVILFGLFLISAGLFMLLNPEKARNLLRKAGSTNFINYAEITLRIIPAISLILYSEFSKYPLPFQLLGWFMLITSFVLYFVPRKKHHQFSLSCANILKPVYFQILAPFSLLFGFAILYNVI